MSGKLKWYRGQFWSCRSYGGRFRIEPIYSGYSRPDCYKLLDLEMDDEFMYFDTQAEAKEATEEIIESEEISEGKE